MLENYGTAERPKVCPGEVNCGRFQSAAGKTHAAKVKNACTGCELFPTKRTGKKNDAMLQGIVNEVMNIRYERLAGYPRSLLQMTTVHFEALPVAERLFEREERKIRIYTKQAIFALAGVKDS